IIMYSDIFIIFNPVSTGGHAEAKAGRLAERLRKRGLTSLHVQGTDYPGHAEALAYQDCLASNRPLIVSVSGDGGYNEVVNGVMRAKNEDASRQPVCAILPAGNANDHRRSVRKRPLTWAITHAQSEPMDLLKLTVKKDSYKQVRYAHSYIGAGFTSHAAAQLKDESLSAFKEIAIVARAIFSFHPVAISTIDGKTRSYDSLIFANIHHMSKFMRLGDKADINNGSFRLSVLPHRSDFWLLRIFLNFWLFVFGLKKLPQQTSYQFSVPRSESIHLDGELFQLPGGATVDVTMAPASLPVIR
ncbi:MAG: diacylglycerol kinase family protein, partial [Candidatus Saccharimonadales bacterium]